MTENVRRTGNTKRIGDVNRKENTNKTGVANRTGNANRTSNTNRTGDAAIIKQEMLTGQETPREQETLTECPEPLTLISAQEVICGIHWPSECLKPLTPTHPSPSPPKSNMHQHTNMQELQRRKPKYSSTLSAHHNLCLLSSTDSPASAFQMESCSFNGMISAHCTLCLLGSSDSPASASQLLNLATLYKRAICFSSLDSEHYMVTTKQTVERNGSKTQPEATLYTLSCRRPAPPGAIASLVLQVTETTRLKSHLLPVTCGHLNIRGAHWSLPPPHWAWPICSVEKQGTSQGLRTALALSHSFLSGGNSELRSRMTSLPRGLEIAGQEKTQALQHQLLSWAPSADKQGSGCIPRHPPPVLLAGCSPAFQTHTDSTAPCLASSALCIFWLFARGLENPARQPFTQLPPGAVTDQE
ncbi:hypothetical protein AAY473_009615 [Plecturocebus cupreus]